MIARTSHRTFALLAGLVHVALASSAVAEERALVPRSPALGALGVDHTRMHHDAPGDGTLWARGTHYKARFDAEGATYYPLFGPAQREHVPLALSPDVVTSGGVAIDAASAATAVRSGDRVEIDRGAFVEVYELEPGRVEQIFVFDTLPGRGELVVRVPLACDLEARACDEGIELRGDLGRVTYGRAVAIDARGARVVAPTELVGGAIEIRVPSGFLAEAVLPLVVDPVVTTFPIDVSLPHHEDPDVAYDAASQRWLVVYQEAGLDADLFFHLLDPTGTSVASGYVDVSTLQWGNPRCANLRSAGQFLVVAGAAPPVGESWILGRTIRATDGVLGSVLTISETGDDSWPDVGGDPRSTGPAFYCVSWIHHSGTPNESDILARLVAPDGSVLPVIPLSTSAGTEDTFPNVSKSNGGSTWMVCWRRTVGSAFSGWFARVRQDGVVLTGPTMLAAGPGDLDLQPSSPLNGSERTLVAWSRANGADRDLFASVLDGATVIAADVNLSALEGVAASDFQTGPGVDSDGQHFLVAYAEGPAAGDRDIFVSDFFLAGNTLHLAQTHLGLGASPAHDENVEVASTHGAGGPNARFLAVWERGAPSDVHGALVDVLEGGDWRTLCLGDGTDGPCPCGNQGAAGRGCASSVNPAGALLQLTGTPSTWNDTAQLVVTGVPNTSTCFFLMSSVTSPATPLGDGLACFGGTILRMGNRAASGGTASFPNLPGARLHDFGAIPLDGGTRLYQTWYRNAAAFCTSATFNLSNGVLVAWAR